ncbi:MAG TPA: class I SAM-dependent methyltransferase [Gemmatimonadaceae bacterium]
MHSRELGLVLAQQLGDVDDLHYGLWDPDLELRFSNLRVAQQRYSDMILSQLPPATGDVRVLDVGCGTGHLICQMLDRGYLADGVIPAPDLGALVRRRIGERQGYQPRIFECKFEDFPVAEARGRYDVVLFSESFQYIKPSDSLPLVQQLLKPGGMLLICDFFKTAAHGDGGPGDKSFGGGHPHTEFVETIARFPFVLVKDDDITTRVSPNLELLNDWLMNRAWPASQTIDRYLSSNYSFGTRVLKWFFRKKLRKLQYKYFSGHRSRETFERYKTYRLLVYRLPS